MRSPSGWAELGQRPELDEFTIVLQGTLVVESGGGQMTVQAGQGVHTRPGEWVRYSTPGVGGAEYISVCVAAFALAQFTGMTDLDQTHELRAPSGMTGSLPPDQRRGAWPCTRGALRTSTPKLVGGRW